MFLFSLEFYSFFLLVSLVPSNCPFLSTLLDIFARLLYTVIPLYHSNIKRSRDWQSHVKETELHLK